MTPPLDLRLALAGLVAWAATLWALSARAAAVAVAAALALLLALAACRLRRWTWRPVVGFCAAAVSLVLMPLAVRLHSAQDSPLAALARARTSVTAELTVTADPRPLSGHDPSGAGRMAVQARLTGVDRSGRRSAMTGSVLVLAPSAGWGQVLPGQRIRLDGRLSPPLSRGLVTATLSARRPPELVGQPPWWQRAAGQVRAGLQRASTPLPRLPGGLLPGLVDGDTSRLDPVLADRFRVAGLTHLVAVSGSNLSLLIGAVGLALRRVRASPRTRAAVSAVVLISFVIVARPSASVVRAAAMAGIALFGLATGRPRAAVPVLAAAVLLLLVAQPSLAPDLGFILSVAATGALLLIAPGWASALRDRRLPGWLAEALAVAAAAHLVTAPIVVGISGRFSLVAIPANMLAEPVVGLATVFGVLAASVSVLSLPAAEGLAWVAGWPCRWLAWVAEHLGALSGAAVPWPSGIVGGITLAAVSLLVAALVSRPRARPLVAIGLVVAVCMQIPVRTVTSGWPPPGWLVVACDVGQGDAIVMSAGGGDALVVDAGPDPIAVDRCLRGLGVTDIGLLVLTHSHLDHVGGIAGVLHGRHIAAALTSPLAEPAAGHRLAERALAARGVGLGAAVAGTRYLLGRGQDALDIEVLGPRQVLHGTRSDPNNASVVLRVRTRGETVLLPGDAEVEAQDELLAAGVDLSADIVKVPHHGSAYSDPVFLQRVHARLGLISVGEGNDYGHPSPLLLAELDRLGVAAHRTDREGDIAVAVSGGRLRVQTRSTRSGNS